MTSVASSASSAGESMRPVFVRYSGRWRRHPARPGGVRLAGLECYN